MNRPSLHLLGTYLPATQTWLYRRLKGLGRYPPEVVAWSLEGEAQFPLDRVRVYGPFPKWRRALNKAIFWPFSLCNSYYRLLQDTTPRIIHSHFAQIALGFRPLRRLALAKMQCPSVCSFYGYDLALLQNQAYQIRLLFKEECGFVVEGPHMGSLLVAAGCDASKVYVNPLGIDLTSFPERKPADKSNGLKVMVVGRFCEKKGFPDAIRALMIARKKGMQASLTLVGDGPARGEIEAVIARESAGEHVRLTGSITYPELLATYYSHDVLLQPSVTAASGDTEGGAPVSLIEGMAAGLPIVATRHADIPNTVAEGENALLADENCPGQLAECLLELSRDKNLRERFSVNGRRRALHHFDDLRQAAALETIYDTVIAKF